MGLRQVLKNWEQEVEKDIIQIALPIVYSYKIELKALPNIYRKEEERRGGAKTP